MHSLVADHYQYLPICGVIAVVCAAGWTLVQRRPRAQIAGGLVAAAVLAFLVSATVTRAGVLASGERLWADTIDRNPESWAAHYPSTGNIARRQYPVASRRARPHVVSRFSRRATSSATSAAVGRYEIHPSETIASFQCGYTALRRTGTSALPT